MVGMGYNIYQQKWAEVGEGKVGVGSKHHTGVNIWNLPQAETVCQK